MTDDTCRGVPGADPFVEVAGLTLGPVAGGPPVLDDAALKVRLGQVVGVLGRSGSGKSSLAHSLLGHVRPGLEVRGGTVRVAGLDPFERAGARRLRGRVVSFLGQDPASSLNPALRIGTQLAEAVRLRTSARRADEVRARVEELLLSVRLPADRAFRRRLPRQLSGGQAQRVALALALAGTPSLLVLDEPTSSLDTVLAAGMRTLLGEVLADGDRSALLVSHDPAWLASVADDVILLDAGRVAGGGVPTERAPGPAPAPGPGLAPAPPRGVASAARELSAEVAASGGEPSVEVAGSGGESPARRASVRVEPPARGPGVRAEPSAGELAVRGLDAAHGRVRVLRDVSLTVRAGCCTAVVGPSGSGKTTLARCLAGLHRPARGGVEWREHGDGAHDAGGAPVQLVAQDARGALNPRESVRTALLRPLTGVGRRPARDAGHEAVRLLGLVGLDTGVLARRPGELSGGQRQRVALARTLAARPRVLVCDEITSALDRETAGEILALLGSLRRTLGLTVVMVTHDLAAAARHAERVVVLDAGRVAEAGPVDRVLVNPEHPVTRELLAFAVRPGASVPERR
ncbi:ATP-binding cassette domain-containing protein [Streptomyces olivaceus]|uniref:ATP-binding cassette domain-containing protein n=1 Tax=Streptomyces olivaceus TaxID=47716 RepID=A0ABS7VZD7_STROV|nr:ATP-binding cassette domain-containing protein [Streptomyces olivaceus]MBZ6087714.1 ATP-binding cassette domain-containing protein [Streptomyces olivaceus]MBZ6095450.1 ATP-binding cassette domain-containing protein [Streptomyces olivaceus]MBZ6115852.1 ATP-binding cassette domain-containing protein [Streptomyces olivaceus]MBZ6150558.1 ATP-binding cassette domain-containing protein [Streptomyces olivaceus]MBZ6297857.1 ATP-binding cassette domain-containing protein [Streptomyces olivaceus]